jgi:hypothetical protein
MLDNNELSQTVNWKRFKRKKTCDFLEILRVFLHSLELRLKETIRISFWMVDNSTTISANTLEISLNS